MVCDSLTGKAIPFVSVIFEGSSQGVISDDNGTFYLLNKDGYKRLIFRALGYETKIVQLKEAAMQTETVNVLLSPTAYELENVTVRPHRERYSRRNNPAVDLIRKVIEHKDRNRIESKDAYKAEVYEKLSLAVDYTPEMQRSRLLKPFSVLKNYLDTSEYTGKPMLTLSIRELLADYYYRKTPRTAKTIIKARQQQGVDRTLDDSRTLSDNLQEIFKDVNLFDNDITLLINKFVSPLSSILATRYYKYYITDTLDLSGERCVNLSFTPANSQSYGFTGCLYVTLDGNYSIKKVQLNIPFNINLNWVNQLRIEQEFVRVSSGLWVVAREDTYGAFAPAHSLPHGLPQLYAHRVRSFNGYNFDVPPEETDRVFHIENSYLLLPEAEMQTDTFWLQKRHIPLQGKEQMLPDLLADLQQVSMYNVLIKALEIIVSDYVPSHSVINSSRFDFGPVGSAFSSNYVEGSRIRAGGMTTANLHPQWFAAGYLAYGMRDCKLKYQAKLTHSFTPRMYHEKEYPFNHLSFMHAYDVYTPGQSFLFASHDNLMTSFNVGAPLTQMQYIRKTELRYEKEYYNHLSIDLWAKQERNQAAGTLSYNRYTTDSTMSRIESFMVSEAGFGIRYAPGERAYNSRKGRNTVFNLSKDAPILKLSHRIGFKGLPGGDYAYHHTEIGVEKRYWLSSFGHIDAAVKAGYLWSKAPFPLLILPNANQSVAIQSESFAMMRALEFVTDRYASFFITYYMKGWIFNRIPLIQRLQLREVISVNGLYGGLSDKNNPQVDPTGLFQFPQRTSPLGKSPYMEASVGIDNIFNILRVDYYRRLTYLHALDIQKDGFRIAFRFAF
jgi:hypothetical protein